MPWCSGRKRPADGSGEIRVAPPPRRNDFIGRIATAIFLAGWATGGVLFGIVGDKWGRAFTMMLTILVYSVFTGLSALSVGWIDYSVYRFMTGMGVGGEFAAGAAFVAEVMPARARPYALGLLQSLSAVGNIVGSLIARVVLPPEDPSGRWESWRVLYVIGILPALLVVFVRRRLKEPARWTAARETATALVGKQLGAFGDLFRGRWRVNTIYGVLFAVSGVIGVWGISFWTPELIKNHIVPDPAVRTFALALQDVGAFLGLFAVGPLTQGISRGRAPRYLLGLAVSLAAAAALRFYGGGTVEGSGLVTAGLGVSLCVGLYCLLGFAGSVTGGLGRRASFCLSFALSLASVLVVFRYMTRPEQVYWLTPLLGFATLMPFGMYAIYFPELYPTRLRTTGTGFCYNVARYLAVVGLFALSWLGTLPGYDLRVSTQVFAAIYLVGIVAAFFAPETKDRPLAEE
ncbi:MAG: MFS transporter [Planctomycetes bacterium]|nr:MFS transporter [Planctomycetota bacterium]